MDKKRKDLLKYGIIAAIILAAIIVFSNLGKRKERLSQYYEVTQGLFEITVENAGELSAERSVDIKGPELEQQNNNGRGGGPGGPGGGGGRGGRGGQMRMEDLTIQDLVPEGTIVKEGDYVAQIDQSSFRNTLKSAQEELASLEQKLKMAILDTAISLSDLRQSIAAQKLSVEEAKIKVDMAQYEAPAIIRQRQANLESAERALKQLQAQCDLKRKKIILNIQEQKAKVDDQMDYISQLENYIANFTIKSPADGMVIYHENRLGIKTKTGSSINSFENIVATLPDLTSMLSTTYVSEIDVNKVQIGMDVKVTVDAKENKTYTGKVISIANVGETLGNSDSKMFEVIIRLDGVDMTLRPQMTTWNKIIVKTYPNTISVPFDCVHATSDGTQFVYKKNKTRQVVSLGEMNDKSYIVNAGLEPGTFIYIIPPEDGDSFRITDI
ncbi:MAG: HlyD family efflux transporter periplasmic adaptor subunit [Bacteroidales bacterium]|nr:HlyD family efflux transporter periplasmic adaptor subunit [Bacteroidales bacterium]MBP5589135.1 HlyD family efflux transporter periplasmic adaptor subunit [Bacteroidales bacterium]